MSSLTNVALNLMPCGMVFRARDLADRVHESAPQSINIIGVLVSAVARLRTVLPDDARQALFHDAHDDLELRTLMVSAGLQAVYAAKNAAPDPKWLLDAGEVKREDFQSASLYEDAWLEPEPPAP